MLGSGWAGGWNVWREGADSGAPGGWKELMGPTGHFDAVKTVAWGGKHGEWVVSVSSDETTRIHAPWVRDGAGAGGPMPTRTWAEIARPQVHGYPLTSLAPLPGTHGFVSGADEKVVRVFGETKGFLESLVGLGAMDAADVGDAPVGASVPPLGLSNKMVSTDGAFIPRCPRQLRNATDGAASSVVPSQSRRTRRRPGTTSASTTRASRSRRR